MEAVQQLPKSLKICLCPYKKVIKLGTHGYCPQIYRDLIPVDHICYLVVAIVNRIVIDMSEVEKKHRFRFTPGNPAYSRRMLLRLVIMASVDAIWSSRKIARLAHENVVYMYLKFREFLIRGKRDRKSANRA